MNHYNRPNGWVTTAELCEERNVNAKLCYDWFDLLEQRQLCRRASGGAGGTMLYSPSAQHFIASRKLHQGNPHESKAQLLDRWLDEHT